jgi:hypothetical protein
LFHNTETWLKERPEICFKFNYNAAYSEYTNETPIPVITGAPGTISSLNKKYPDHITVKHDTKELQSTTTMGTEHILLKVRMLKYKTFVMGNNITLTTYCNHRTAATIYTLETWFVSISLCTHWINNNNNNNKEHNSETISKYKNFKTKYSGQYPQVRKMKSNIRDILQSNEKIYWLVRILNN